MAKFTLNGKPFRAPPVIQSVAKSPPVAKPAPAPTLADWMIHPGDPKSYQRCREMAMSAWKSNETIRAQHPNMHIYVAKVVAACEAISAPPLNKNIQTFTATSRKETR